MLCIRSTSWEIQVRVMLPAQHGEHNAKNSLKVSLSSDVADNLHIPAAIVCHPTKLAITKLHWIAHLHVYVYKIAYIEQQEITLFAVSPYSLLDELLYLIIFNGDGSGVSSLHQAVELSGNSDASSSIRAFCQFICLPVEQNYFWTGTWTL